MNRLIEKTVFCGFVTAWRLATWPTSRSPSFVNATTEGVVRPPSALGITTGSPPSITATTEFVVPRSIPMIFSAMLTAPYQWIDAPALPGVASSKRRAWERCQYDRVWGLGATLAPSPQPLSPRSSPHVPLQGRQPHRATSHRDRRRDRRQRAGLAVRARDGGGGAAHTLGVQPRPDSGRGAPYRQTRQRRRAGTRDGLPGEGRPQLLDRPDLDVHARQLAPPAGQHAVPVGVREQHRRRYGARPVRGVLPAVRRRRGGDPGVHQSALNRADGRGVRRDQWSAGRLSAALSASPRAHAHHP